MLEQRHLDQQKHSRGWWCLEHFKQRKVVLSPALVCDKAIYCALTAELGPQAVTSHPSVTCFPTYDTLSFTSHGA